MLNGTEKEIYWQVLYAVIDTLLLVNIQKACRPGTPLNEEQRLN
jgi:hypothetical protein